MLELSPVLSLALSPGWALDLCCSLVSGPIFFCSWRDPLDGPWTWCIACLAWGCRGTLSAAPASARCGQTLQGCALLARALPVLGPLSLLPSAQHGEKDSLFLHRQHPSTFHGAQLASQLLGSTLQDRDLSGAVNSAGAVHPGSLDAA